MTPAHHAEYPMQQPDPRIAALAEQLHKQFGCRITCRGGRLADDGHPSHGEAWADTAAAILAALPPDWCGHIRKEEQ